MYWEIVTSKQENALLGLSLKKAKMNLRTHVVAMNVFCWGFLFVVAILWLLPGCHHFCCSGTAAFYSVTVSIASIVAVIISMYSPFRSDAKKPVPLCPSNLSMLGQRCLPLKHLLQQITHIIYCLTLNTSLANTT